LKKLAIAVASLMLALGPCLSVEAQTTYPATYTGTVNYVCHAASLRPVTSFDQFDCWGINFFDHENVMAGTYYFRDDVANYFNLYTVNGDAAQPTQYLISHITQLTGFTEPNTSTTPVTPGTFSFTWTVTDADSVVHTGSVSGTWINKQICGGRGCQYWAPQLVSNSITMNN
jgi:hypothetical protein